MLDSTSERLARNGNVNSPGSDADELCISQRNSPAAKIDSDRALVEAVERALCAAGYPALRGVQIEFERGIVVLWGRVPNYHQKQLAQSTVQRVEGVRGIANGIEIACRR